MRFVLSRSAEAGSWRIVGLEIDDIDWPLGSRYQVDASRPAPALTTVFGFRDEAGMRTFVADPAMADIRQEFDVFVAPHSRFMTRAPLVDRRLAVQLRTASPRTAPTSRTMEPPGFDSGRAARNPDSIADHGGRRSAGVEIVGDCRRSQTRIMQATDVIEKPEIMARRRWARSPSFLVITWI